MKEKPDGQINGVTESKNQRGVRDEKRPNTITWNYRLHKHSQRNKLLLRTDASAWCLTSPKLQLQIPAAFLFGFVLTFQNGFWMDEWRSRHSRRKLNKKGRKGMTQPQPFPKWGGSIFAFLSWGSKQFLGKVKQSLTSTSDAQLKLWLKEWIVPNCHGCHWVWVWMKPLESWREAGHCISVWLYNCQDFHCPCSLSLHNLHLSFFLPKVLARPASLASVN